MLKSRIKVLDFSYPKNVSAGVDFEYAKNNGIKVIWALSLPGKVAPDTAGDIVAETILNILEEMEV